MASSLGKMQRSRRGLISPYALDRFSQVHLGAMRGWKGHVGEHIGLGLVHERGELRQLGVQLIGDPAPLCAGRFGIVLDEGGGDESGDHAPTLFADMRQHVAQNAGVVEKARSA